MPQVNVTIAGKAYRMACGEGEEPHLEALARLYDGKIDEMRQAFGEIGDMRLHVMAALMVADEMTEMRKRIAALEQRLASPCTAVNCLSMAATRCLSSETSSATISAAITCRRMSPISPKA